MAMIPFTRLYNVLLGISLSNLPQKPVKPSSGWYPQARSFFATLQFICYLLRSKSNYTLWFNNNRHGIHILGPRSATALTKLIKKIYHKKYIQKKSSILTHKSLTNWLLWLIFDNMVKVINLFQTLRKWQKKVLWPNQQKIYHENTFKNFSFLTQNHNEKDGGCTFYQNRSLRSRTMFLEGQT